MTCTDGWKDDEHDKYCEEVRKLWALEQPLAVTDRSSSQQIFTQISNKLSNAGFRRGPHAVHGHWYNVVLRQNEFRNTFPFHDPPPTNGTRNSSAPTIVVKTPSAKGEKPAFVSPTYTLLAGMGVLKGYPGPSQADENFRSNFNDKNGGAQAGSEQTGCKDLTSTSKHLQRQRAYSLPANTNSDLTAIKKTSIKWSTEEFQKFEELTNAAIKADRGKPEGARLKDRKFFDLISKQLKELGIERGAKSCQDKWQRIYPIGNDVERGYTSDEGEPEVSDKRQKISQAKVALEASDLALIWTDKEKENLARCVSQCEVVRKDERGVVILKSVNWGAVMSKHNSNEYKRTLNSLKVQWGRQKAAIAKACASLTSQIEAVPQPNSEDSEDDKPLSQVRSNKFKRVSTASVKPLSFDQASPTPKSAHKSSVHGSLIISKKRNHTTTFATASDDEIATRENQRPKRQQTHLQEQADIGLTPMEVKIKQFNQEIKDLERETANAPRTIQNYESELLEIDAQLEKLRKQKERIQTAKMQTVEIMAAGSEKVESLKSKKAQLVSAMAIMRAL